MPVCESLPISTSSTFFSCSEGSFSTVSENAQYWTNIDIFYQAKNSLGPEITGLKSHECELYYFRARYYSGELGRFVSRDPLGYIDGMSFYMAYFVVSGVDPSGLLHCADKAVQIAAMSAGIAGLTAAVGVAELGMAVWIVEAGVRLIAWSPLDAAADAASAAHEGCLAIDSQLDCPTGCPITAALMNTAVEIADAAYDNYLSAMENIGTIASQIGELTDQAVDLADQIETLYNTECTWALW